MGRGLPNATRPRSRRHELDFGRDRTKMRMEKRLRLFRFR